MKVNEVIDKLKYFSNIYGNVDVKLVSEDMVAEEAVNRKEVKDIVGNKEYICLYDY